jgi:ElaB/YqjD/DUF883 family membrane-anchored ribosome-binding protein
MEEKTEDAAAALARHSKDAKEAARPNPAGTASPAEAEAQTSPGEKAESFSGLARAAAERAGAAIGDAAGTVSNAASEFGDRIYDHGTQAGEYASRTVQERPLASVLIGIGIGYLVGFVLHYERPGPRPRRHSWGRR